MKIKLLNQLIMRLGKRSWCTWNCVRDGDTDSSSGNFEVTYRTTVWNFPGREAIDHAKDRAGWDSLPTCDDWAHFGVWTNDAASQILTYCEGDFTLQTFSCVDVYKFVIQGIDSTP